MRPTREDLVKWSRRHRNRRFLRRHVLGVRARTQQVRAARMRAAAAAFALALGTLIALGVLWRAGEWTLDEWVYGNPSFEIRHLQIDSDGLPAHLVQSWTGIQRGANLLRLDLDRVKRNLELAPVVASVSLQRIPPDTLCIRVRVRRPVARVELPRLTADGSLGLTWYYVDAEGRVVQFPDAWERELERALVPAALPMLVGIPAGQMVIGRHLDAPSARPALRLVEAFQGSSMARVETLRTVDISEAGQIEVVTEQGARIAFGMDDAKASLARWRAVHDYAADRGLRIATLDLSVSNNVPVTLREVGTRAPAPAAGSLSDPIPLPTPSRHA